MNNYDEIYSSFKEWLDNLLENNDMPEDTKAFNFNLYEEDDNIYSVQLIASDRFDPEDEEWACYEVWSSEEDIFFVDVSDENDKSPEAFKKFITTMISDYIRTGKYGDVIGFVPVGIGFVDGEIDILYNNEEI
ncbi:MAG: hypothetical protein NC205_05995 [Prevotella sp.]|nr:hypothetical protein [Alistipes senegalensis]MCM1358128.1 hypothetical protein [Prevotella sp.]MCM1473729.1 hypothetical protein [Muribaculaceae bacterium]